MNYFDLEADHYLKKSQRGLWKQIRRIECDAVLSELSPKPGEKILDVGCGPGFYASELRRLGANVVGIDSSSLMIDQFNKLGFTGITGDFQTHDFKTRFDKILVAGAGEFIEDVQTLLQQLDRTLKVGGRAVILAPPNNLWGQLYKFWHRTHGCPVSLHNYEKALRNFSNLKIIKLRKITPMSFLVCLEHS